MKWSEFFTSSVGKKLVMAFTGLFLISFLIVHAGINACIWADLVDSNDNGEMFNKAAHFMGASYVIRIMEIGLFLGFFLHIIQGYMLEFKNRARRKQGYQVAMGSKGSAWYRKSMGLLGTLILLFLIIHIQDFWIPSRITYATTLGEVTYNNGAPIHDVFTKMLVVFSSGWVVVIYLLGCFSLCWHLLHGFQSSFRTVGVHNKKYVAMAKGAGIFFSIFISVVFALMPISIYYGWVNNN
ncbi:MULTISPECIES: succinate dehydrogenase cytochrome b subunit [Niastella]|uniref:Succinate dehydrogenase cytochrome b subunit n=1 Tax=Niastella soli TaxID=2821487 RepID=A0ABS3Z0H4_9BACT|nr:succinate dehydrogenase cytochrome b subunit [Niastella soli]MBO9203670.1 succinate dehydrogenase cytochrome b subunit [Niastella soli]